MRTEVSKVPKLEYVPLPDGAAEPCLVPMPPLNDRGELEYEDVPAYAVAVLGILEDCNLKLEQIRQVQPRGDGNELKGLDN